jgi:hypothetical protein
MLRATSFKITIISLAVSNVFLMVMALLFDWRTYDMVFIFWCENVVIGFYTAIKLPACQMVSPENLNHFPVPARFIRYIISPAFLLFMLIFSALHLAMIHMMFYPEVESYAEAHKSFAFPEINRMALWSALIALMISHGVSFLLHFVREKEYLKIRMDEMFLIPFKRLLVVHVVVLALGIGLGIFEGNSTLMVILFFTGKLWVDYKRHTNEHSTAPDNIYGWF